MPSGKSSLLYIVDSRESGVLKSTMSASSASGHHRVASVLHDTFRSSPLVCLVICESRHVVKHQLGHLACKSCKELMHMASKGHND